MLPTPFVPPGHFPLTGGIGPIGPLYPSLNQNWKRGFRLRATYFARVGKVGKAPPGGRVWKNTPCFYAASGPGPPFLFTGATIKNVDNNLPAREKTRMHI